MRYSVHHIINYQKYLIGIFVSMGDYLSLKTFDEFITIEMAPSATFVVWHVDESSGAIVYATLTVHVSSRQYTRVSVKQ